MKKIKKEKELGKVTHWYDHLNVAVVKLAGKLSVGDKIKIKKGDSEFEDTVQTMQFDHEDIKSGKKGQEVAIKISGETKDGASIFMVE